MVLNNWEEVEGCLLKEDAQYDSEAERDVAHDPGELHYVVLNAIFILFLVVKNEEPDEVINEGNEEHCNEHAEARFTEGFWELQKVEADSAASDRHLIFSSNLW